MLNLGRLQVLCEVVNRGSFSAAADALSYTQSAVSQAIARLEAETGATLVVRDRRGVRPTAAGTTLVAHAEAIFAQVEAAEAELAAVLGVRAGRLRVASFPSAGATLMPLAVAAFRRAPPRRRAHPRRGRARGDRAAPARRRVRPGAAVRVPGRAAAARAAGRRPAVGHAAGGPDGRGAARRPSARLQAGPDPGRPARPAVGSDLGGESVRPARRPLLPGRGLRALRRLRVRRLRHGPGPGGRRSGGGAHPAAGAHPRAPRDRRAGARAGAARRAR